MKYKRHPCRFRVRGLSLFRICPLVVFRSFLRSLLRQIHSVSRVGRLWVSRARPQNNTWNTSLIVICYFGLFRTYKKVCPSPGGFMTPLSGWEICGQPLFILKKIRTCIKVDRDLKCVVLRRAWSCVLSSCPGFYLPLLQRTNRSSLVEPFRWRANTANPH